MSIYLLPQPPKGKTLTITANVGIDISSCVLSKVVFILFIFKMLVVLGLCCLFLASLVVGNGLSCPVACRSLVFQSGMDPVLEVRF